MKNKRNIKLDQNILQVQMRLDFKIGKWMEKKRLLI